MTDENLEHAGVAGMKWRQRKGPTAPIGGTGRKFQAKSLTTNMDGRKVNKLFGKRNRTKVRQALLGNEKKVLNSKIFKKKYKSLSPEGKRKAEKKVRAAQAVLAAVSIAAVGALIKYG